MRIFLEEIVSATRARVAQAKRDTDVAELRERAARFEPRGFRRGLESAASRGPAVIAELKKASPSKGVIRDDLNVATIAQEYEAAGAAALSVLTEEHYFQGSLANLVAASAATHLPCLRKDFIIDEYQLVEAKAHHADAVLLIVAILTDEELSSFHAGARDLGLDVLCEVHDENELQRALAAGCGIIGVNNRDLRTFDVNLDTAVRLSRLMPPTVFPVVESGIHDGNDISRLRAAGYQGFLIGESLMRAEHPGEALTAMLNGATTIR